MEGEYHVHLVHRGHYNGTYSGQTYRGLLWVPGPQKKSQRSILGILPGGMLYRQVITVRCLGGQASNIDPPNCPVERQHYVKVPL